MALIDKSGLPSEPDVEKLILGGSFSSPEPNAVFIRVSQLLDPSAFSLEKTRLVFCAMQTLIKDGMAINYATVAHELKRKDHLNSVGSLIELTQGMPELHNLESFCQIINEHCQRRRVSAELDSLQVRLLNGHEPLDEITSDATRIISSFETGRKAESIDHIRSVFSFGNTGIEFAVHGLVACNAVTGVTGDSGTGKTTFLTALGASVAVGADFLGRECSKRKVLFLDAENPLSVVQERLERLHIQDGGDLKIWGAWVTVEVPGPDAPCILNWVAQTTPKPLIIIDSLNAYIEGDENDATAMRTFLKHPRRLANAGAAVVIIHHTGKSETSRDYRGSSAFKGGIDTGLLVVNADQTKLERFHLRAFKTRFTVERDVIVHYTDGEFSADERSNAVARTVAERLAELLRKNPESTQPNSRSLQLRQDRHVNRLDGSCAMASGVAIFGRSQGPTTRSAIP